jgi:ubiquinone/menaquinone biosynthesis C-methylase UbiE
MAKKEHWNVDPWNDDEIWTKLIGRKNHMPEESDAQAREILSGCCGERCLEIGAGIGRLMRRMNNNFYDVWGVDSSAIMVALSTRWLQNCESVRVVFNDGWSLPFPTNYFEFVYSFTCFQHMEDLEQIRGNLREAYRVLRPGGHICIQTVCGQRNVGRHDGYVFESVPEFCEEFVLLHFIVISVEQKGEWLWARATKPARENASTAGK